jgi:hypothetical protein
MEWHEWTDWHAHIFDAQTNSQVQCSIDHQSQTSKFWRVEHSTRTASKGLCKYCRSQSTAFLHARLSRARQTYTEVWCAMLAGSIGCILPRKMCPFCKHLQTPTKNSMAGFEALFPQRAAGSHGVISCRDPKGDVFKCWTCLLQHRRIDFDYACKSAFQMSKCVRRLCQRKNACVRAVNPYLLHWRKQPVFELPAYPPTRPCEMPICSYLSIPNWRMRRRVNSSRCCSIESWF